MNVIKFAVLHGSQASGAAGKNSDWDVAVLAEKKLDIKDMAELKRQFAGELNVPAEKIDIADLNSDSPLLRYQVAQKGRLIQGSGGDFRNFQILAWKDYLNNEKIFNLRSQFLKKKLHGQATA
jgi:predicted nucleotidyltransferase